MKQETRKGLQGRDEVETCEMLDKPRPEYYGRCHKGTKAVSRTCRDQKQPVVIEFNSRIAVALTHVSDFVKSRHQREHAVSEAAEVVLRSDQGLVTKQK